MSDIMHVGIEDPVQKRKELLSTAVDTIQALKDFEICKKYSKEKDVYRKHFVQVVKELSIAIHEFKEKIPVMHAPHPEKKEAAKPMEKPTIAIIKKPVIRRSKTHLDKLEDDIASLRDKIANL